MFEFMVVSMAARVLKGQRTALGFQSEKMVVLQETGLMLGGWEDLQKW